MTEKKTDVLNIRMDAALAAEIQRIADWRGTSASEVARDLIKHGIAVERQVEAQELRRPYEHAKIERDADHGYLKIDARWVWYTPAEIAEMQAGEDEWAAMGGA
jgi:hypothetical protein